MSVFRATLAGVALFLLLSPGGGAIAAEAGKRPAKERVTSTSGEALASFRLRPEFRLELVAMEPTVSAPVAMAFDENGRLFVVEMRDYAGTQKPGPHLGRIRLLEDTDDNGEIDTSTVYADDLALPSAIACYDGGVYVAASGDILYLKDSKGDGFADVRRVALAGVGASTNLNPDKVLNNFKWGLDNRIHVAKGGMEGAIRVATTANGPSPLSDVDFSFDPRSLMVFPESGPSGSGLCFDQRGRRFTCEPSHPLRLTLYPHAYARRNPFFPKLPEFADVASPATPVYRLGAAQPARAGETNTAATAGKGRTNELVSATWLSTPRGCVVYRGGVFASNCFGNAFIADPAAHVIHRAVLRDNGLEVVAFRAPDEPAAEFLSSTDPAFRPSQIIEGPEGVLYITDLRDGNDHGRIYRVVPANYKRPPGPRLGKAKVYDLVAGLARSDAWHRDTAARLLYERQDPAAPPLLTNMLFQARFPVARLGALCSLEGLGALTENYLLRALRDPDERVRERGLVLCEKLAGDDRLTNALLEEMAALTSDPSYQVRYQLALTLGSIRQPGKAGALGMLLRHDGADPWMQNAVLGSLDEDSGVLFSLLGQDATFRGQPAGEDFLLKLAIMVGTRGQLEEVNQALDFIQGASLDPLHRFGLLRGVGEGLHRARSGLALVSAPDRLKANNALALQSAGDETVPTPARVEALRFLGVSGCTFDEASASLPLLCAPRPLAFIPLAAIQTLARIEDPRAPQALLARWPVLTLPLRRQAVSALLTRSNSAALLLEALANRNLEPASLPSHCANFLRTHHDPTLQQRAVQLIGPLTLRRPEVVAQFKPALQLRGSSEHGRQLFVARCADCHSFGAVGRRFRPSLLGARVNGRQKLLSDILEPSAEIAPSQAAWVLTTAQGEHFVGLKTADNATAVTLCGVDGTEAVWPRLNVQLLLRQPWSLMPDGLEAGLTPQDMADLLDYLMTGP